LRYIGSKKDLLDFIYAPFQDHSVAGKVFFDAFTGTTVVAQFFKKRGMTVIANDLMTYSYVFARAYICVNSMPLFEGLAGIVNNPNVSNVVQYLNGLPGEKGFFYRNYSKEGSKGEKFVRNYFSLENAQKIDAIREIIDSWRKERLISDDEFYILLCSLLEAVPSVSNIAGTYGAFLKIDDPRKFKTLRLKRPELIFCGKGHQCFNEDANELAKRVTCDILYVDPPYNTRQYAANYHILETIATWDKKIKDSKTGLSSWDSKKSKYSSKRECVTALEDLVRNANSKYIVMSYNTEGIIPYPEIRRILEARGKTVEYKMSYRRFKSNSNGDKSNSPLKELLFLTKID
jgi:adenine-specific DNA-methyltransferase